MTGMNANFADIDSVNAYKILDGNDSLIGDTLGDTLTGGFGGSDTFNGLGGDDTFMVAALAALPVHTFNGGTGTDTVSVLKNIFTGATALDLRSSIFSGIEKMTLEAGVEASINSTQLGGGLSLSATIQGGGRLHVFNNSGQTLDLHAMTVSGPAVSMHGNIGGETLIGTAAGDTIIGGGGRDVMTGGLGGDIFDFDAITDSGKPKAARDLITDFVPGLDEIDLSTIDANGAKPGDTAFKFVKKDGADFGGKAGQLIWDRINKHGTDKDATLIQLDTDGNGKPDLKIDVTGLIKLIAGDFVL